MTAPDKTNSDPTSMRQNGNGFGERAGQAVLARPGLFSVLVVLALVLLPVAAWLDLRNLSSEALTRQATDLNGMISEIRSYYGRNVIGRIQDNKGNAVPAHNYEEVAGGVPIPATLSIELGSIIGKRAERVNYRFVSDEVFKGRAPHQLDRFEASALVRLRATSGRPGNSVTEISGAFLNRQIRMAVPVVMGQSCVTCHNKHPQSPKKDWKVGDVRGIQAITIEQPLAENVFSFKYLMAYLLGAGAFGSTFAALQWRQARQFAFMNSELEEANSFLASVSMKISKYLSPQVYKSIFSGERDAVISTERKKLTIFFSDIKDFTVTTERLQPEELTALLNEYFTEMAAIAHVHGGTVDKFIGDAILVFFGDPETRGAALDAHACLEMAIAMQRRMAELRDDWRQRGIEKPFEARMGINTGYCNVGNFGSADRMDYTIIGAEANLAARLQDIAEPGGIVMSYETYALVKDLVTVRQMAPISLKGISREIIPFAIEDIHIDGEQVRFSALDKVSNRFELHVDIDKLDGAEGAELEEALKAALDEVRRKRSRPS
jgi:class 3 adenylate cyclase